jgi:hypothetical protein
MTAKPIAIHAIRTAVVRKGYVFLRVHSTLRPSNDNQFIRSVR